MPQTYGEKIRTLIRRRDHLVARVQESHLDLSYDKREIGALNLAIRLMTSLQPRDQWKEWV